MSTPPRPDSADSPVTCPRCEFTFVPRDGAAGPGTPPATPPPPAGADHGTVTVLPAEAAPATPTPPTPTNLPAGVGRFEVRAFLGEGSFGRVYEAYDPSLKRLVALKVAKPEQVVSKRRVERFLREARAAANLLHPNVVAVFDSGQDGAQHYIATALVQGRPLAAVLEGLPEGTHLPLRQAVQLVRKLAEALAYAHRSGVVHRDVKPGNVMLRHDGEPLLMDFGLAARADEQDKLTVAGQFMGTPQYTAPEQWAGKAEAASDQYSLGCLLFELLAGRPPFAGSSGEHYLLLHTQTAAPSPRKYRPGLPRDLETISLKCLEKEPGRRYADCQALADDLRRWLDGEPVTARPPGPAERLAKWARRNPALAALVGVCALAGVALAAVTVVAVGQREAAVKALASAEQEQKARALAQVSALQTAAAAAVPAILEDLEASRDEVLPRLRELYAEEGDRARRMRLALALLPVEPGRFRDELAAWMLEVPDPAELLVIRNALMPHAGELRAGLWEQLGRPGTAPGRRLRLLAALAAFDPQAPAWREAAAGALPPWLADNPLYLGTWTEALRPARESLLGPLAEVFRGERLPQHRAVVAGVLADYLADQPDRLAERLLEAEPEQFEALFEPLRRRHRPRAIERFTREVRRAAPPGAKAAAREALARGQANAGLALLKLGEAGPAWPLLRHGAYPEARSRLIALMGPGGVEVTALAERLLAEKDTSTRRALILALGELTAEQVPADLRRRLGDRLVGWYRDDPDPGVHGAIDWLLRHGKEGPADRPLSWGRRKELEAIDAGLAGRCRARRLASLAGAAGLAAGGGLPPAGPLLARVPDSAGPRAWYVNGEGQTLVVVDGREPFLMGSPADEEGRFDLEKQHWRRVGRRFAIGARPVTVAEFGRFHKAHPEVRHNYTKQYSPQPDCPIIAVAWYEAAAYCRWLSEQEGVPEQEMVYPPVRRVLESAREDRPVPLQLPAGHLGRVGYRLPTEAECELACRAGAPTSRYYGTSVDLLPRYAWFHGNSKDRTWPVGQKRPNDMGLFDMHGNVWSWCQESLWPYPPGTREAPAVDEEYKRGITSTLLRALRGGSFLSLAPSVRSAYRFGFRPALRNPFVGLRVCRTYH
jgi:formylglycine-generating enzyme required for sulfatase activity